MNSASSGWANNTSALENDAFLHRCQPIGAVGEATCLPHPTPGVVRWPVSDDARRIRELERGFRRDGLPNLIVDFSAAEDVFTRAIPFLSLVFVLEVVNAMDLESSAWENLLLALGGAAILFGAFGLLNVVARPPFLSVPSRVGAPELAAFVVLPALLPIMFSGQYLFGFNTMLANLALLRLVYLVVGFGLVSIVRWAGARFFHQLGASVTVLVRAVPLLLFFSLVMFFTTEIWQVFTTPGPGTFWTAMVLFVAARDGVPERCGCRASCGRCRGDRGRVTCRCAARNG